MIADAPYIREAERLGMPPYGEEPDYSSQIKTLKECDKELDAVVDMLQGIEYDLDGTEFEAEIRDLIDKVEEIGCDVRAASMKLHFGYDR